MNFIIYPADPSGRAVWGVDLRHFASLDCGFEFRRRHGYLLWVLCVVRKRSLRRTGQSSRGFLPTVVCMRVISEPQ